MLRLSAPDGRVLATDADASAIARAGDRFGAEPRLVARQCWIDQAPALARSLGFTPLDGVLMDLGLSSFQLDQPERGFAFMREGPLDMRFDASGGPSAAELIERTDPEALAALLRAYGDVPGARRIAEAIWAARPITTTVQLREVVTAASPSKMRSGKIHPATLVFQALRIAVNDELRRLRDALPALIACLRPGGRIAAITFHSLEDRIVKEVFRDEARTTRAQPGFGPQEERQARLRVLTKDPITPSAAEVSANPRARSAKLRVAERLMEAA